MSIKISRKQLESIVAEELTRYLAEQLNEAPAELDDEEPLPAEDPTVDAGGESNHGDDMGGVPELPGDPEADADLDALEAGEEPPSEEEEGTVAGEISGKTIEKISVEEESEVMPGATEIIFTFREIPDAFRLLVTKTGKIKYFFRGLHSTLESEVSPVPEDDGGEDFGDEEFGGSEEGGEELEDMPPMGDEDMPPEDETSQEEPEI